MTSLNGCALAIASTSERKNVAWDFIEYCLSEYYLNRVKEECEKTIPASALPEFKDEIKSIEDYLEGKVTADYILRYWKPYEYAKEPVAQ